MDKKPQKAASTRVEPIGFLESLKRHKIVAGILAALSTFSLGYVLNTLTPKNDDAPLEPRSTATTSSDDKTAKAKTKRSTGKPVKDPGNNVPTGISVAENTSQAQPDPRKEDPNVFVDSQSPDVTEASEQAEALSPRQKMRDILTKLGLNPTEQELDDFMKKLEEINKTLPVPLTEEQLLQSVDANLATLDLALRDASYSLQGVTTREGFDAISDFMTNEMSKYYNSAFDDLYRAQPELLDEDAARLQTQMMLRGVIEGNNLELRKILGTNYRPGRDERFSILFGIDISPRGRVR